MSPHGPSMARYTEALARAQEHWRKKHEPGSEQHLAAAPTIALSREAGVSGSTIAHEVGKRLGWPVYGRELLEEIAKQLGLRVSLLESVDEKRRSWIQDTLEDLIDVPGVNQTTYVRYLTETILSLGAHGECVIVGRGVNVILSPATTLRVRLIASREDRIATTSKERGLGRDEAARWIEQAERERRHFIKTHYFKDLADPLEYDLILNTSRWSSEECAELIVEALHRFQSRMKQPAG